LKILVVNVALRPKSPVKYLPLGLAYVATAMKKGGFTFDLLDIDAYRYSDEYIESFFSKTRYDIVLLGCIVTGYRIVKDLTTLIRRYSPKVTIIVGNSVASSIPELLLSKTESDIAVIGEGDITVVELLNAIQYNTPLSEVKGITYKIGKEIIRNDPRPPIKDISTIPRIDYSIWDFEKYIEGYRANLKEPVPLPREQMRGIGVNTARGCINRCTFCYHVFRDVPYRHRDWKDVFKEIEFLIDTYNINFIGFQDELTFYSKKSVVDFIQVFKESGLKFFWTADCRGNLFTRLEDVEIIKELKALDCLGISYSLESSNPEILKKMNKHMTVEQFTFQTNLFHEAGLTVWTSLVFGFPQESPQTIRNTMDCCIQNGFFPSAGYLLPFPGSEIFEWARENGFIDKDDEESYLLTLGDRQDLRINLTSMSNAEFESILKSELDRANKELGLNLQCEDLTKTQYYRVPNKS